MTDFWRQINIEHAKSWKILCMEDMSVSKSLAHVYVFKYFVTLHVNWATCSGVL